MTFDVGMQSVGEGSSGVDHFPRAAGARHHHRVCLVWPHPSHPPQHGQQPLTRHLGLILHRGTSLHCQQVGGALAGDRGVRGVDQLLRS